MTKNNQDYLEQNRRKGRKAVIVSNIYFSISLVVYTANTFVLYMSFNSSKHDLIDYICYVVLLVMAVAGLFFSVRGLIALCQPKIDEVDVGGYYGFTIYIALMTCGLIFGGGLVVMLLKYVLEGPSDVTFLLVFMLEIGCPFIVLIAVGCFMSKVVEDVAHFRRPKSSKRKEKNAVGGGEDSQSDSQIGLSEEVSLNSGVTSQVSGNDSSYAKAPGPDLA